MRFKRERISSLREGEFEESISVEVEFCDSSDWSVVDNRRRWRINSSNSDVNCFHAFIILSASSLTSWIFPYLGIELSGRPLA